MIVWLYNVCTPLICRLTKHLSRTELEMDVLWRPNVFNDVALFILRNSLVPHTLLSSIVERCETFWWLSVVRANGTILGRNAIVHSYQQSIAATSVYAESVKASSSRKVQSIKIFYISEKEMGSYDHVWCHISCLYFQLKQIPTDWALLFM